MANQIPWNLVFKNERHVILYLYLLHCPRHPYEITKTFRVLEKTNKDFFKKRKALLDPGKMSSLLSEMNKIGIVEVLKEERTPYGSAKKRIIYSASPEPLYSLVHIQLEGEDYEEIEKTIKDAINSTPKTVSKKWFRKHIIRTYGDRIFMVNPNIPAFESLLKLVSAVSPSEIECLKRIANHGKYDYITILLHCMTMFSEMYEYKKEDVLHMKLSDDVLIVNKQTTKEDVHKWITEELERKDKIIDRAILKFNNWKEDKVDTYRERERELLVKKSFLDLNKVDSEYIAKLGKFDPLVRFFSNADYDINQALKTVLEFLECAFNQYVYFERGMGVLSHKTPET